MDQSTEQITDENCDGSKSKSKRITNEIKKTLCRYGHGCTHINDPLHQERFTHPSLPILNVDLLSSKYICYECGTLCSSLPELQLHLKKKTAWSNTSLLGCRISCLVDNKEWHEGIVTHYHKTGKHSVEFKGLGEKRWISMTKVAFYILEHPQVNPTNCEFKENDDTDNYSHLQENEEWTYVEDLSLDFAFTQSILFKVYDGTIQETGHKTRGHVCLTENDRENAKNHGGSLLYGELLPRGVNKALGVNHLNAAQQTSLFDLGMGTGKVVIQAFLQYRNLKYVYGIELAEGRYKIAENAILNLVKLLGPDSFDIIHTPGVSLVINERIGTSGGRVLKIECGDMLLVDHIHLADIIMMETDLPSEIHRTTCELLCRMHENAMILTYHDMKKIWISDKPCCLQQLDVNKCLTDRFPTSWSVQRGHHFFLWQKSENPRLSIQEPESQISRVISNERNENINIPPNNNQNIQQLNSPESVGCFPHFFLSFWRSFTRRNDVNKILPVHDTTQSY